MVKKLPILIALTLMLCACQDKVPLLLDLGIPRELAEFRKAQVSGVVYGLSFEIPRQQAAPIPSTLELSLEIHDLSQPLYLDFNADPGLLKSLQVNGNPQKIVHQKEHLILEQGLHIGQNSVVIGFDAGQHSLNRNADYLYT